MAKIRSVDFLPQIFQTDTNRQFLSATLDVLTQEPQFKKTQGFIGRRVGPGVVPEDVYVVEPNKTRADYQLEPSVVSLVPDTNTIKEAMTYPGLADAISYQGGNGSRSDRLYRSEYYTWDPYVDFDTLVNFNQYYWLPYGPEVVDVSSSGLQAVQQYNVTRANGVYTFNGVSGDNPIITLVRGGSYTFNVAQTNVETINFRVQNQGVAAYLIDRQPNPTLTLQRGNTYIFTLNLRDNFPFWIKTQPVLGRADAYDQGVQRNGAALGAITFTVPRDAPNTLYYTSENNSSLQGQIDVVDNTSTTGAGFWIQTNPGISGTIPATPNISSRDVLGVQNNGVDQGQVIFNVPRVNAQQFYYDLPNFLSPVDLLSNLRFDEINNQPLLQFIETHGGIDGITNLAGRTLILTTSNISAEAGGWYRTSLFDTLDQLPTNNGLTGSFDSTVFDQTTEVPPQDRRQLWKISYVRSNGIDYLQLEKITNIPLSHKFAIRFGAQYSSTQWWKTPQSEFEAIPPLTAVNDVLWYQDGTDPEIFGRIRLVDAIQGETLFIEQILDQKQYTSPNGVQFTNGLKVRFVGDVVPDSYSSGLVQFECTASNSVSNTIVTYDTSFLRPNQQVVFQSPTVGGLIPGLTYYVAAIVNELEFTVSLQPNGPVVDLESGLVAAMLATAINNREYYVSGVGTAIRLLPVGDFVTPEQYVVTEDLDGSTITTAPEQPDYITIDRASMDRNAWSRSNRWFHRDVIQATAEYNGQELVLDNQRRGRRPIIQFRPNIRLFNMGTQGKDPINVIDLQATDAFSDIQGSLAYSTDGYALENGTRIVFAVDIDPLVRNKIYQVEFITPDSLPPLIAQPVINLRVADDGIVLADQTVVCLDGDTVKGVTYRYDGDIWIKTQQKTKIQQPPLFDVYDSDGVSFSDSTVYPSTNFVGTRLFSYSISATSVVDPVLQLPLQYLNITNIGDLVFENNFYTDQFIFTVQRVSQVQQISTGFVREYLDRTDFTRGIGWQTAATQSQVYQQFRFEYRLQDLVLDVRVRDQITIPSIKIYVNNRFVDPGSFTYTRTDNSTTVTFVRQIPVGALIELLALSDQTSNVAFREVPINLENNPFNANSSRFSLGTIRQHYDALCENLIELQGQINGANNTRDLGNIVPYGLTILQQSSPLTLAAYFLRDPGYSFFESLIYNGREYVKFKNLILDNITQQAITLETSADLLDRAIENVTKGRISSQPFYWSDMLPSGPVYTQTVYTVTPTSTNTFDLNRVYDYTKANYQGFDVYFRDEILLRGVDYVAGTQAATFTVLFELAVGDVLTVREYDTTYGSFCPNTPTKLGLYPAWRPTYVTIKGTFNDVEMIRGHDGSLTPRFGDLRDGVLLEFERRIYNNLKLDGNPVPLMYTDVIPGQFRDTGYSFAEVSNILNQDFLSWLAWNKLDYRTQDYRANNEFSWNYSTATNTLDNKNLLGAWRGIYRYFYDCEQPQISPWEMLGFTVEPDWWEEFYGAAPYTRNNLVLWEDLEAGLVRDPAGAYVRPEYVRPGLTKVIPTGEQGELLSPFDCVVANYDSNQFRKSWTLGDGNPVQSAWVNSSSYPFAVMRLLALTRPAKFFSLFVDRDLYRYDESLQQYLFNQRYRIDANGVEVYGDGISKASFIDWIVDYNRQTGVNSTEILETDLANLDVRLCYRMASFSDKQLIQIYTDRASPAGTNTGLLLPDQTYNLLLYKNQPFARASYSAVLIQNVPGGYAVFGYSTTQPYFNIKASVVNGRPQTISAGSVSVRVPSVYSDRVVQVPYGFIFRDRTSMVDFLLSYGQYLVDQGVVFDSIDNGYVLDWQQMSQEFLFWSQQGWADNTVISINPLALRLTVNRQDAVVDSINVQTIESLLLDQNRRIFDTRNLDVVRTQGSFSLRPLSDQVLSYIDIKYVTYEHMIVLNNTSEFGDLIYDPVTGARQSRLNLVAVTTTDWDGSVNTPGFILNEPTVQDWNPERNYAKGEIVFYKGTYWSAAQIVQPSARFNYNQWLQSDYTEIQQGLLPNLANKADQLANSYNINAANLEQDDDLFSYGLIGFRPRQYMSALNLDDVSQVNIYRQFLGTKGTVRSLELFSSASLRKEVADYDIYENWGVQQAVYGANANRSFFELRLNRALLNSNPSIIQVVSPQQVSRADQAIMVQDIWRESYPITSPDILPVTLTSITDTALPSAGYVNLNDIDITVFDLGNPANLSANLSAIQDGTSIWVARVNDYDWNVYRCEAVPGVIQHVCDNLDQTSLVIFSSAHGLKIDDTIVIKLFDTEVDGVYQVLTVPSLTEITIAFAFRGDRTIVNGTGFAFALRTQRVAQFSDVIDLPYANLPTPGARVWIDNDGDGQWIVVEKQPAFGAVLEIAPQHLDATEAYGSSVAQATNGLAAMVGSSRLGFNAGIEHGGIYVYVRNPGLIYEPTSPLSTNDDAILKLVNPGVRNLGFSLSIGNKDWGASGAPGSLGSNAQINNGYVATIYRDPVSSLPGTNPYLLWQLLTTPGNLAVDQGQFGYSVVVSSDERWMYVGAPGVNEVYAYGRVTWQDQVVVTQQDGSTFVFPIDHTIQASTAQQIEVFVNDDSQTLNVDYVVLSSVVPGVGTRINAVQFVAAPDEGSTVRIERKNALVVTIPPATTTFAIGQSLFTATDIYSFSVLIQGELQRPGIDYTFDNNTQVITFLTALQVGHELVVRAQSYWQYVSTLSVPGMAVVTSSSTISLNLGIKTLTVASGLGYTVNQAMDLIYDDNNFMQGYVVAYNNSTGELTITAEIITGTGTYATWTVRPADKFGHSVSCTTDGRQVMIGAPWRVMNNEKRAGAVYVFDRNVQRFVNQADPSTISFVALGTVIQPVSVLVNNEFLVQDTSGLILTDAPNQFSVSGNTITINADLRVGDFIDIETNQFRLLQTLSQDQAEVFSNFGQAVNVCGFNCSLYVGAPQSSVQIFQGGVVERNVNQARVYGTISSVNTLPLLTPGNTLRINNQDVAIPAATSQVSSLQGLVNNINNEVPNVIAVVSGGTLVVSVANRRAAPEGDLVQVLPGSIGTAFTDLGFEVYQSTQTITSPYPRRLARFGTAIGISDAATQIVIGAPNGNMYIVAVFDDGAAVFDDGATDFFSETTNSGAVYVYDFAAAANATLINPDKFVVSQQIEISDVNSLDLLGSALDYTLGLLYIAAPGSDKDENPIDDSTNDYGRVYITENPNSQSGWRTLHAQQPVVDVRSLNSVFFYDLVSNSATEFLDFFDPLQGKILGAARQNIDYVGAVDPAGYNSGAINIRSSTWTGDHVGEIWWDTSTVRFINPNQDDVVYAARRWGQTFPGSGIDVYQWIFSTVPPAQYIGPGVVKDISSYSVRAVLQSDGTIVTEYFFWVRGLSSVAVNNGKTLSVSAISQYIDNPRGSGISYLAALNANTVAIYNCQQIVQAQDTVLHIEFDKQFTNDNVHVEYQLIPQDRADGWVTPNIYQKLQDSLCGVDVMGNLVPDVFLSPPERYGVQFRPRQSMFVDRFLALKNFVQRTNNVLALYPITETRRFVLLNSRDPEPTANSGLWNKRIANNDILSYQDIYIVPLGYAYLVESDQTQQGLWTIYDVVPGPLPGSRTLRLKLVQNYDTPAYWQYIDWVRPGYNASTRPVLEVPVYADLQTVSVPVGSSVKVLSNNQGKFEIWLRNELDYERVVLEDGTIALDAVLYNYELGRFGFDNEVFDAQYFDQAPTTETRKIIQAVNQELFIDDLLIERNRLLMLMFDYVLSENIAPEWLVKTSLIDVNHRVRALLPFQNYRRDNQEFIQDYIQEVKPYHTQIREFNLAYFGQDDFLGDVSDFDLPAYYNFSLPVPQFVSPILTPYAVSAPESSNILSNTSSNSGVWQTWPYTQWYNNFLMIIDRIDVIDNGSGYTGIPEVEIQGDAAIATSAVAVINGSGQVIAINILSRGTGYRSTPTVVITGGNGQGARAYARLENDTTRDILVRMRFDRLSYRSSITDWESDGTYENGTLVRYRDAVWRADNQDGSSANVGPEFDLANWQRVPASELSGIDRTRGYYVAGVDMPGVDLPLLIDGIDYPGVQVRGQDFVPDFALDVEYRSSFADIYLGTRATDINIDGGEFLGTFEGHAPQELVNGAVYDTLDLRVFTRPGSDWVGRGHGFAIDTLNVIWTGDAVDWSGRVDFAVQVLVNNATLGLDLAPGLDYTVDWASQTIAVLPDRATNINDIISVSIYELGGGNQLFRQNYLGSELSSGVFQIPVNAAEITEVVVFVNGQQTASPTFAAWTASSAWNIEAAYAFNAVVRQANVYYRALQAVPPGTLLNNVLYWQSFVPFLQTQVTLLQVPPADSSIAIVAMGVDSIPAGYFVVGRTYTILNLGNTDFRAIGAASNSVGQTFVATGNGSGSGSASTDLSWSTAQVQYVIADESLALGAPLALTNSMQGVNAANLIVTRNGVRLPGAACRAWTGDGNTVSFGIPYRLGVSFEQSIINPNTDITVWIDDVLQVQNFGSIVGQYYVTEWGGSNIPGRQVIFNIPPPLGSRILIALNVISSEITAYQEVNNTLVFYDTINVGDVIEIISWNDTSQQDPITQIFVGPVIRGVTTIEGYDQTLYDQATVSNTPGSFNYTVGQPYAVNEFYLDAGVVDAGRLWVTLDGRRLYEGRDFTVRDNELILASGPIQQQQILIVTSFTDSIVPNAYAFRIFQDMRGVQAVYRITPETTTTLTADVNTNNIAIAVQDVQILTQPNIDENILGVITIDGERITYRERDTASNVVTGIRRGTAGTAVANHAVGSAVYLMGRDNLLPEAYQDYAITQTTVGDGSTRIFYFDRPQDNPWFLTDDSSVEIRSLEVFVGGTRADRVSDDSALPGTSQYKYMITDYDPLALFFVVEGDTPPSGSEITVIQRRGIWWYDITTAQSRELSLQETTTVPARFLTDRSDG